MQRTVPVLIVSLLLAGGLGGCDTLKSMGLIKEDPEAERTERLRTPPDLSAGGLNDSMAIPERGAVRASEFQPNRVLANPGEGLRLQRAGEARWLEVDAPPARVWEAVKAYLQDLGLEVAAASAPQGVLYTGWVRGGAPVTRGPLAPQIKDPDEARVADQFQFRLESGSREGSTEVYVAHRRAAASSGGEDAEWTLRQGSPFFETEMLRGFMLFLGATGLQADGAIGGAEAAAGRAQLLRAEDGQVRLQLQDRFFDAWRRVGLAVDRLGFTLEDRDRSQGRYFVRYDPDAESRQQEKGLLESLAFWRDDDGDELGLYVIQLQEAEGGTSVTVTDEAGEPVPTQVAERILALLSEQLR